MHLNNHMLGRYQKFLSSASAFHAVSQQPLNIVHIFAGISNLPLLLLAFRAVSQQPLEYFLQERDRLTKPDPR
jgi:hypothetical protein